MCYAEDVVDSKADYGYTLLTDGDESFLSAAAEGGGGLAGCAASSDWWSVDECAVEVSG